MERKTEIQLRKTRARMEETIQTNGKEKIKVKNNQTKYKHSLNKNREKEIKKNVTKENRREK